MYSSRCNLVFLPVLLGLWVGLPSVGLLVAQESSPQTNSPSQWVLGLADSDPQVRRLAEFRLLAAGDEVVPALEVGVQSFDLEVSSRCSVLLEKIKLRERGRVSKLFLVENKPVDPSLNLAAWPAFRAFVGGDGIAVRRMFLAMCHKLPTVFEDYGIRGEQSAPALAKTAATVLNKRKDSGRNSISAGIAFLFLTDLAISKREPGVDGSLFDDAETTEFVEYFTNASFPRLPNNDSRPAFQKLVARWILQQKAAGFVSDSLLFRFVHQSRNKLLLEHLMGEYDSFDASLKLQYLDVVMTVAAQEKAKGWRSLLVWLEEALADDTIAVRTRRKNNPSEELAVTMRMLAQGTLAQAIRQSLATGEPVKSEGVFGSFELSGNPFRIVADEQEQTRLEKYLESHLNRE